MRYDMLPWPHQAQLMRIQIIPSLRMVVCYCSVSDGVWFSFVEVSGSQLTDNEAIGIVQTSQID